MATKQVIRELVTLWGFSIDQQPLKEVDAGINVIKQSLKTLAVSTAASAVAIGFLLNEAGEDEQTRIAFETMLGSAEAMEQKLRELEDFAVKTPFTLKGVKKNTKLLLAMGIEAEKLVPTLKFLGDVSAGLSVPLERLALNYGQVRNQNKLTGREMRDFAVAGVPLLDVLAKNLGKTTQEIQSMVSRGEVGFGDVEKAFQSMTEGSGRFADLMTKQSKSFFGILSNIQDVIQLVARDLGNDLLPEAKRIASAFMEMITVNRELILQDLSKFVKSLAEFLGDLFDITIKIFKATTGLVKVFGGWNKVLKITFNLIASILGIGFVLGIGLVTKAVLGMIAAWWLNFAAMSANILQAQVFLGVSGTMQAALIAIGNSALVAQAKLMAIPLAIGAIITAIALIAEDIFAFSEGRDSVFGRMIAGMDMAFAIFEKKFGGFARAMKFGLSIILKPIRAIVNGFKAIGSMIDVIRGKKTILEGLKEAGAGVLNTLAPTGTARSLFGLSESAGAIDDTISRGATAGAQSAAPEAGRRGGNDPELVVQAKNEITLNVIGMAEEAAKELVTQTIGESLGLMMKDAVRDGASIIQR